MLNLEKIESDLVQAMKSKNQIAVDTLRGLKTRIQNEQIAKMKDADESAIVALIRSEVKKRKEAAEAFGKGGRAESAEKELSEIKVLEAYLPQQMSAEHLSALVDGAISESGAAAADFGKLMGKLKAQVGDKADGAMLAKLLKEKLK